MIAQFPHKKILSLTVVVGLCFHGLAGAAEPKTPLAHGRGGAVATISDAASHAALTILNQGGNAIDAAVAAAATLGVTDPFSCGIGGGGFMLIYLAKEKRFVVLDHRETAPASASAELFVENGKAIAWEDAVSSGRAVGVPGTVRGWDEALKRYGSMQFKQVLAPAIQTAEQGFKITPIFHHLNAGAAHKFALYSSSSALYLYQGKPLPVGHHFKNPDIAKAYRAIAQGGANAFYRGPIADALLSTVNHPPVQSNAKVRPGNMSPADLLNYEVRLRQPVHSTYRGYDLYGLGLPSSGGMTVAQALNVMENFDTSQLTREQIEHLYLEAARLAFADRNAYIGDPEFVDVPVQGLLNKTYALERARSIRLDRASDRNLVALPGDPYVFQSDPSIPLRPRVFANSTGSQIKKESTHTTHLTVSDKAGNIVSYTYTIEDWGGNGMVVPGYGFLLNNELTDFDFSAPHPNVPEAGKRPRSSIAPVIAFKDGKPAFTIGSPGGATIITTVLQTIVNHIDLKMDLAQALAQPRMSERNDRTTQVEPGFIGSGQAASLAKFGHQWNVDLADAEIGAANAISFHSDGTVTAMSEPRRHGVGSALVQRTLKKK
ncbi:gamma-glutamyltransferase [Undibacterium fentianense]|uniref:Glutathione hydrolase proenzyme n=1 Tax=Undibacterium fentianense TaxID=2828728 RepID=A0A941DZY7_9BURK|nr:gamma-glutamyltransferase [Undibacterium fentianense]MBR7800649.1 gamma-glutamyltransferase [Undibacterium fentianense]